MAKPSDLPSLLNLFLLRFVWRFVWRLVGQHATNLRHSLTWGRSPQRAEASSVKLMFRLAGIGLCLVLLLVLVQPAYSWLGASWREPSSLLAQASDPVEALRQQQQQIEQERTDLQQQRTRLQNLEQSAQNRLEGLQDTIQVTAAQISYNEDQLQVATDRLKQLQADLAKAEETYQERQFSTVARLRFLQRQQNSQGWAILLQSRDFNEFLDRRQQLKRVYESDRTILGELKKQADDLNRRRSNIERQKNEIALLTQQLQAQKAQYEAQAKTQAGLIERLRTDRRALEEAEQQLARDSSNLAALIRDRLAAAAAAGARNRAIIRGTGRFTFPSEGVLTSDFGYRTHPILGYQKFHAGVDFGGSYGTPIRSADSGIVIFAGWYGGYGRSVIVDHGNGLTTLYAHASEVYVQEGQAVQRGEAIAAIGSTGLSTGPHLHFEVRQNGEPVDPMSYL